MELSTLDWTIIAAYLAFALGVGIYYSKRAGKSPEEYYLAGRSLPWWVVGTSMVATSFAADTPLAITEMSRVKGIWENWFWWNWLLYGLLAVFLFSRLWRRAKVLTENELIEIRYSGKPAAALRAFKAGYFALLFNFIVMAWVINGMSAVLTVMLGNQYDQESIINGLVVIAVVYCLLSGFWGVVVTDVVQFVIAMVGAVALAVIALHHVGGMDQLLTKLDDVFEQKHATLAGEIFEKEADFASSEAGEPRNKVAEELAALKNRQDQLPRDAKGAINIIPLPPKDTNFFSEAFLQSQFFQFLVLILVMWWSNHSTDGGGYLAQRTMAAKNEKHALAANLWYTFSNFALRTWPWVIVALVSLVLFPEIQGEGLEGLGEKAGYPLVMKEVLGSGMRGLLIVSFLAAFMSTIDTHLNWGSSYLVHDIYRRFIKRNGSEASYVMVGRIVTILLMITAAFIAKEMTSIEKAWKFVMAMGSGIGLVLILRWFWWRINAWSEISALVVSVAATVIFELMARSQTLAKGQPYALFGEDPIVFGMVFPFHLQLLLIVAISLTTWISVTFLTKPEPEEKLIEFYKRVQPGGWWSPVSSKVETTMQPVSRGFFLNFIAGMAFVWGGMFCIGNLIFKQWGLAAGMGALTVIGFSWIWHNCISKIDETGS